MDLPKKRSTREITIILIVGLAALSLIIYVFLETRSAPEPVATREAPTDKWIAPADKVSPWAVREFDRSIHSPTALAVKSRLGTYSKITKNTPKKFAVEFKAITSPILPSKVITVKLEDLLDNLYVGKLVKHNDDLKHDSEWKSLFPNENIELSKEENDYLDWVEKNSDTNNFTGLPRIVAVLNKNYTKDSLKRLRIFDKRTKVEVASSWESYSEVAMLHPAPVILMIDLADPITFSTPLAPVGTMMSLGDFECKLIEQRKYQSTGGYGYDSSQSPANLYFNFNEVMPDTHNVFHVIEWSSNIPIKDSWIEITTIDGKIHKSNVYSGNQFAKYETSVDPTKVQSIMLKTRPYYNRYIIELDELPNMYEPNREVTNLFNIKIPNYAQHPDLYNIQSRLIKLTQLKSKTFTAVTISRKSHNFGEVTVREMIERWLDLKENNKFDVNKEKMTHSFNNQ